MQNFSVRPLHPPFPAISSLALMPTPWWLAPVSLSRMLWLCVPVAMVLVAWGASPLPMLALPFPLTPLRLMTRTRCAERRQMTNVAEEVRRECR